MFYIGFINQSSAEESWVFSNLVAALLVGKGCSFYILHFCKCEILNLNVYLSAAHNCFALTTVLGVSSNGLLYITLSFLFLFYLKNCAYFKMRFLFAGLEAYCGFSSNLTR